MIVDTLGLVMDVMVHRADIQDRDGGDELLLKLVNRFMRLEVIWADGGYAGSFVEEAKLIYNRVVEIVKRSDVGKFVVLPKRWIVERTFVWLGKYRRLSKDCEDLGSVGKLCIGPMLKRHTLLTRTAHGSTSAHG